MERPGGLIPVVCSDGKTRWKLGPAPPLDVEWSRKAARALFLASEREKRLENIKFNRENPEPREEEPDVPSHIAWCEEHIDEPLQAIGGELIADVQIRNMFVLAGYLVEGVDAAEIERVRQESEELEVKLKERLQSLKGTLT